MQLVLVGVTQKVTTTIFEILDETEMKSRGGMWYYYST